MRQFPVHTVACQTWALGKAASVVFAQRHGGRSGGVGLHEHEQFAFEDQDEGKAPCQMVLDPHPSQWFCLPTPQTPQKDDLSFPLSI